MRFTSDFFRTTYLETKKSRHSIRRSSHGFPNSTPRDRNPISPPANPPENVQEQPPSPVILVNRSIREDLTVRTKVETTAFQFSTSERRSRVMLEIELISRREEIARRVGLGFRVSGSVFCLISFSVMAADKTKGWSGDSYDRYKQYRYCLSVAVIAFVYCGFQAYAQVHQYIKGKHIIKPPVRYFFDFFIDQVLAYLLMSASSSAATRTDIWQSNWGKDEFTEMADAAAAMSFFAFLSLALNSLISGYNLSNQFF